MSDLSKLIELSSSGNHFKCLQASRHVLDLNPSAFFAYKYAGISSFALNDYGLAHQYLLKAYQYDSNDPDLTHMIGQVLMFSDESEEAFNWFQNSITIDPCYSPSLTSIANHYRMSGAHNQAVSFYRRSILADPLDLSAYRGASLSCFALKELPQAELFAKQALDLDSNTYGMNEILGLICLQNDDSCAALEYFRNEISLNSQSSLSLLNHGLILLQQDNAQDALVSLLKLSIISPSDHCSILLAQAYQSLGRFQEAIIHYRNLNASIQTGKLVLFNLGICLLESGDNSSAVGAFAEVTYLDNTFISAWDNLGTALTRCARYEEAIRAYNKVLSLDENNYISHFKLGQILFILGRYDLALSSSLCSLALQQNNFSANMLVSSIYQKTGNFQQSLHYTLQSIEIDPNDVQSYCDLAIIYRELDSLDLALAALLKALELKSDSFIIFLNLGCIYKELGDLNAALHYTLKSLELSHENPDVYANLGGIYKQLGHLDDALACTCKSLSLNPNNADACINLGMVYRMLGKLDDALEFT